LSDRDTTYKVELFYLQMLLVAPVSIINIIRQNIKCSMAQKIFVIMWFFSQWALFVSVGSNLIISYFYANFSITVFFLSNIYITLDKCNLSKEVNDFMKNKFIELVITLLALFIMYSTHNLLTNSHVHITSGFFKHSNLWAHSHFGAAIILIGAWITYIFQSGYEIFGPWPKIKIDDVNDQQHTLTVAKIISGYLFLSLTLFIYAYAM